MKEIIIKVIQESEFSQMQRSWNEVLENSHANEVFLLWEWIDAWWSTFRNPNRELFILGGVNEQGEMIGFAPFYRENMTFLGIVYGKMLKMCGDPETYPDHLDLFCRKDWENGFAKAIFHYLKKNGQDWDYIDLNGVSDSSLMRNILTPGDSVSNGLLWDWRDDSDCPFLETIGGFSKYLDSFSSKKRYTLLKKRKLLSPEKNFTIKELAGGHEIGELYDTLVSLHGERAERKGIRSTFSEEKAAAFHKKLIKALMLKGKVALTLLYRNDIPLAAYYCYRHNRKYYFYQSGISREGEKHSAGVVLLSRMIQKCFDEGYLEFDFLRGSEEYKEFWTDTTRKNLALGITKKTPRGKLTRMIFGWQKKMAIARNKTQQILFIVKDKRKSLFNI